MTFVHHAEVYRTTDRRKITALKAARAAFSELEICEVPTVAIDQVRDLISSAYQKPLKGALKTLFVVTNKFSPQAEQALLKLLEEPPISTKLVFCVPKTLQFLPTINSRVQEMSFSISTGDEGIKLFADFLKKDYASRLAYLTKELAKKDPVWENDFINSLSDWLNSADYQRISLPIQTRKQISKYFGYLYGPGASKKLLLEAIALVLPAEFSTE